MRAIDLGSTMRIKRQSIVDYQVISRFIRGLSFVKIKSKKLSKIRVRFDSRRPIVT